MKFYKFTDGDYIIAISTSCIGEEITEAEYNEILSAIRNKPQDTETIGYRLKTDLTWESYEKEPQPEPEPTAEEALSILLGGAV